MRLVATPLDKQSSNTLIPFIKMTGFFLEGVFFFSFEGFFFTFSFFLYCNQSWSQTHDSPPSLSWGL